jgi:hypothetical protein
VQRVIPDDVVIPLRETRSHANGWAVFTFKVTPGFLGGTLWFYVTAQAGREVAERLVDEHAVQAARRRAGVPREEIAR